MSDSKDSFLKHLKDLYQRSERDMVTLSVRVTQEDNAKIQDLADTAGITRQEVLSELIKKYAIPAYITQQEELNANDGLKDIQADCLAKKTYFLVNTNKAHDVDDHNFMIENGRVAAFEDGYTQKIEKIKKGDVVFLYESGVGIRAYGTASGIVMKTHHYNAPDKTFYQELEGFKVLEKAIPAKKIRTIMQKSVPFIQTMIRIKKGENLLAEIESN
ncbi:hypothetical protein [Pantoea agglomerans]|uniref:hypothetical protein n=1 Tax=Enterobacter agglomerans TaxID=549 RepID=UPI001654ABF3|nr:hypothetical protein [Pantoea agglomerans]